MIHPSLKCTPMPAHAQHIRKINKKKNKTTASLLLLFSSFILLLCFLGGWVGTSQFAGNQDAADAESKRHSLGLGDERGEPVQRTLPQLPRDLIKRVISREETQRAGGQERRGVCACVRACIEGMRDWRQDAVLQEHASRVRKMEGECGPGSREVRRGVKRAGKPLAWHESRLSVWRAQAAIGP